MPLPEQTLLQLREFWVTHRHTVWIFPKRNQGGAGGLADAAGPMSTKWVWVAFKEALQESGTYKEATVHTLRHSWATHLLEAGVTAMGKPCWSVFRPVPAWADLFSPRVAL